MQLHRAHEDISDAGARLVFIGQATPKHASHFRRRFSPSVQILADEERETYKLAGTVRGGAAELIGPSVVLKGIGRSVKNRSAQGRPIGDVRQLGGSMIVMPDGTIPWSHLSTDAADNATVPEIIKALRDTTG
jgi:hypothetical protein